MATNSGVTDYVVKDNNQFNCEGYILVTGGLGFIGSNVALTLARAGYNIVIIDNRYLGELGVESETPPREKDIRSLLTNACTVSLKVYHQDMRSDMTNVFTEQRIEGVVHLAGYKSVSDSLADPFAYYENNLRSTLNLLEMMRRHHVKNLLFSSSCTVYKIHDDPISETDTLYPSHPYGWSKYMIERMLEDMTSAGQLNACSLRYFNPLGRDSSGLLGDDPSGQPTNLFPLIEKVLRREKEYLEVFGEDWKTRDGTQIRDYIHIRDLSRAHLLAYRATINSAVPTYSVYNLGTGRGHTVKEVLACCEELLGVGVPYRVVGRRVGDVQSAVANTQRAATVLGWKAELSLDDMIKDCIQRP